MTIYTFTVFLCGTVIGLAIIANDFRGSRRWFPLRI